MSGSAPPHVPRPTPAVFLDRDGTLVEDVGYLSSPDEVVWFDDTLPALRRLSQHFLLFVVTNQSGVALGRLSIADVTRVNYHIHQILKENGIPIQRWYVCPHTRDDGCNCIKPKPYFLEEAAREFDLSLGRSFAVGDHPHDVTFATNVGAEGLYLLTGHGERHRSQVPDGTPVFSNLMDAARWIVDRSRG